MCLYRRPTHPTRLFVILLPLLVLLFPAIASAAGDLRPKVGLVLSGGGARGAAHIGVLKELERLQVPVDFIAGTSMGAIIGGLYASGMSASEIEKALLDIDWDQALSDEPKRNKLSFRRKRDDDNILVNASAGLNEGKIQLPKGLLEGQNLGLILKSLTLHVAQIHNFDELSIPFRAVASDISTGQAVVMAGGDLAAAMRASMAVPTFFSPVEIDGKLLVDGGVSDNLPVGVVRKMGAGVVIAVDISTPLSGKAEMKNLFSITEQLTSILTRSNTERSLATLTDRDILILPDLGEIGSTDFKIAGQTIEKGLAEARAQEPKLKQLSLTDNTYQKYLIAKIPDKTRSPVIGFIHLNNQSRLDDAVLRSKLAVKPGDPLDLEKLEKGIGVLYGMNLFQKVSYRVVEEDGRQGLTIDVVEKPWGPNYLQAGLSFEGLFSGNSSFNIAAGYRRTALNTLGGEWFTLAQAGNDMRLYSDIYQPLDVDGRYFLNPYIDLQRYSLIQYDGDQRLSEHLISSATAALEGGRNIGNWGELRLGLSWSDGNTEVQIGQPTDADTRVRDAKVMARLSADTLDSFNFPASGVLGSLEWRSAQEMLGSDSTFDQGEFHLSGVTHLDRNRLLLKTKLGYTPEDDAPLQDLFTLGGFGNLSGMQPRQIYGQNMGLLTAAYYRRMGDFELIPLYLGGTLEAGNVWQDNRDFGTDLILAGSLFLGLDTFVGPVYIGFGHAEGGFNSGFIYLGNPFHGGGNLSR